MVNDKDLIIVSGILKSPPMSQEVRIEIGYQLRLLQQGELLSMPVSRPMPSIGKRCHELRVSDSNEGWRLIYRIDTNEILILDVFKKKTRRTPKRVIELCRKRLERFDKLREK